MKTNHLLFLLIASLMLSSPMIALGQVGRAERGPTGENYLNAAPPVEEEITVKDPLQPMNRAFFHFNDKLYFWVLKPVAKGYGKVIPEAGRKGVRNFFSNITTPVRLVNCALQGKIHAAGTEAARFGINTTMGVLGFGDPAFNRYEIAITREDFGQTLGHWGVGPTIYINWPILGPSNGRDTFGFVGDYFVDPVNYFPPANIGAHALDQINYTSLSMGEYESFKRAAIDPYISLRQAYMQYRQYQVEK